MIFVRVFVEFRAADSPYKNQDGITSRKHEDEKENVGGK